MGLINYTNIEDDDAAIANLWNSRFAPLYALVNGNLDSQNLAAEAVGTAELQTGAATAPKIGEGAILPSKMNNVWVGATGEKSNVTTSWHTVFNKTVSIEEAAYIYVIWTARGNSNKTNTDPGIRILVNDEAIYSLSGGAGLELMTAKINADMTFSISGITPNKLSGNVNVKLQVNSNTSNGWDCAPGFTRIDALGDNANLDI